MKMNAPLFFLGLLVLITPFLGIPSVYENVIFLILGITIMALTYSKIFFNKPNPNLAFDFQEEDKPIISNFFNTDVLVKKMRMKKRTVSKTGNVTNFDPLNGPEYEE